MGTSASASCSSDGSGCPFHRDEIVGSGLSEKREVSSIPKAGPKDEKWVYPSERMFFKAMSRKGWRWRKDTEPDKNVMKSIIALHNGNNEAVWAEIKRWEEFRGCEDPRLVTFRGDAKAYTPRARIRHWIMGKELPFDRHDWVVDSCGTYLQYVIDFYDMEEGMNAIDVRPTVTSATGLKTRIRAAIARWTST